MDKCHEALECTDEKPHTRDDARQWAPQHLQAANCTLTTKLQDPSLLALTPPQGDDMHGIKDVDVRGPGMA